MLVTHGTEQKLLTPGQMYVSVGASWGQPMDRPGTDFESVHACVQSVSACVQTELEAGFWPVPADRQSCMKQEPAVLSATSASASWGIPAPGSAAGGQGPPGTGVREPGSSYVAQQWKSAGGAKRRSRCALEDTEF